MPHHAPAGNYYLKFDLAAPEGWTYAPGDTIIGNLVRKTQIVTPEAVITLSFTGRVKVKITHAAGNSKHVYRDSWELLNSESVIFQGPLHLAAEDGDLFAKSPLTWPISVDIPYKPKPIPRGKVHNSFFPRDNPGHPGYRTLPGSFHSEGQVYGSWWACYVEYYLRARLRYNFGGVAHSHEAVCPILVRYPAAESSQLSVPKTLRGNFLRRVTSQRLFPGMENAELSVKQHVQKFFYSSKLPSFNYALHLTVPAAIQLDNPIPIPLQVEVVPDLAGTSGSIKDVAQRIRVVEIQAILISRTHGLALSKVRESPRDYKYEQKTDLNLQRAFAALESPLIITTGKGNEPVHVGNMFQLTLGSQGLRTGNRRLHPSWKKGLSQIYPDFTTYNIQHKHTIEWKIRVNIVGEPQEHNYFAQTEIIAPA
ncbi:hypothetical protein N7474_009564 [Penicillium riverlandense]|uniref:uncharacterized protein n=1 Tax=Penicillium riverlandense TaxID=1903569 RepID=UPI002547B305|nr:uncharacterized protein N7474_009564 [Penicillium riverlandense]KAJ5808295.1 hypothetical protein N7474_009564 [Penicillium riverlandense]